MIFLIMIVFYFICTYYTVESFTIIFGKMEQKAKSDVHKLISHILFVIFYSYISVVITFTYTMWNMS